MIDIHVVVGQLTLCFVSFHLLALKVSLDMDTFFFQFRHLFLSVLRLGSSSLLYMVLCVGAHEYVATPTTHVVDTM